MMHWSTFQFEDDGKDWAPNHQEARDAFMSDAVDILQLPAHRKREADWYKASRVHPIGLPPLKWSSAMFRKTEEIHGQQATKARRGCHEVTAG